MTALIAVVPYSAIVAIAVWVFGKYEPKFGALGTWVLATQIAGLVAIAALVGFALSFAILNRATRDKSTLRYLFVVAVPVVGIYVMLYVGFVSWLFEVTDARLWPWCVPMGAIAYLPGLLVATGVARIPGSPNKTSRATPDVAPGTASETPEG